MICRKNYYVVSLKDMQIIGKLIKDQNNRWRANSFRKFTLFFYTFLNNKEHRFKNKGGILKHFFFLSRLQAVKSARI